MFERSDEYMGKICMEALDNHVLLDSHIEIRDNGFKLKAYCRETNTNVQFPTSIRVRGREFIADVVKARKTSGTIFYRAYRNSIRDAKTGVVVA